ncbi:hypothetical protein GGQ74_000344 [Desulfobaculum xiamenense]|uniref:Secreted protein n=1 Tax=Desulfobaculum xiamenense TaxID=995050 RepID=A0A846QN95_9BACT|nr:hypothetical protein [Desulfobaculum xiamenense]NJB66704.1 hypothetical protein [Desulfobaculum xiamenense]
MRTPRALYAILVALLTVLPCATQTAAQEATCSDIYEIYMTCYNGGKQMDQSGCDYLVQALGPRLIGEDGISGFSAALSTAICKRGCEDGAKRKPPMTMNQFRREFCGKMLK